MKTIFCDSFSAFSTPYRLILYMSKVPAKESRKKSPRNPTNMENKTNQSIKNRMARRKPSSKR